MTAYTTITEKGQITLPVEIRQILKDEMEKSGTTDIKAKSGDGWASHAREKYGPSLDINCNCAIFNETMNLYTAHTKLS